MKILLLIISVVILKTECTKTQTCEGIQVRGKWYKKEVIAENVIRPYKFSLTKDRKKIFFSQGTDFRETDDIFRSFVLDLETKDLKPVNGINNGYGTAVDIDTGDVYLSGNYDGIYKYNPGRNEVEKPAFLPSTDVMHMFFKDGKLYFIDTQNRNLHYYEKGVVRDIEELNGHNLFLFFIDDDNNSFYFNSSGLYEANAVSKKAQLIVDSSVIYLQDITTDKNGDIYIIGSNEIYAVDKVNKKAEKIATLEEDAYGLAFDDNNNIIFAYFKSIVRLRPADSSCDFTNL